MRPALAAAFLAGVLAFTAPASAHAVQQGYALASTPVVSFQTTVNDLHLGGANFEANGEVPVHVDIADATGGPVSYTICQDSNGALCGEAGEPAVVGCGTTANLAASAVPFRPDLPTVVFVRIASQGCGGVGTSGTITVAYAV